MIRLIRALRRKPGMSRTDFLQYWRDVHGPAVAKHAASLNILRYTQLHTLDDPINAGLAADRGGMEPPYDGVAELWWNCRDDMIARFSTTMGQTAGGEFLDDEYKFLDVPNCALWFAYEYPQFNPSEEIVAREHSGLVKMFYCLRHPSNQSLDEAQLYWRTNPGPIVRGLAGAWRLKRYLQVHYYEEPAEQDFRNARGTAVAPYTGHAELWFDHADLINFGNIPGAVPAMKIAIDDEAKFIDFSRSSMWIGKEHTIVDRR